MKARFLALFALLLLTSVFLVPSLLGQTHVRHSRYPSAPSNDPQLLLPTDQAQSCFTPESSLSGYDQFEQFDVFPQPASKGYLCINIPGGKTFVIAFGGEVVADDTFLGIVHDLNLLHSLGIRLVVVHGSRPQIDTAAPSASSRPAIASPMPDEPPAISATRPVSPKSMLTVSWSTGTGAAAGT